jgi:DNA-binding LacI/PurR family transcriptional regulator
MAEVARRAGVSVSTVSHVVNHTRFVSPEKAKLINDAIAAMGYQPNELARSLKIASTNSVGLAISVGCLWVSHYALGLTGPLADNISANVVGLALGTMFRFWSYRRWVFPEDVAAADDAALHTSV